MSLAFKLAENLLFVIEFKDLSFLNTINLFGRMPVFNLVQTNSLFILRVFSMRSEK